MGRIRQATLRRSAAAALDVRVIAGLDFKKYHSSRVFREFAESQAKTHERVRRKAGLFCLLDGTMGLCWRES